MPYKTPEEIRNEMRKRHSHEGNLRGGGGMSRQEKTLKEEKEAADDAVDFSDFLEGVRGGFRSEPKDDFRSGDGDTVRLTSSSGSSSGEMPTLPSSDDFDGDTDDLSDMGGLR
jgi:hypothetical protein